MDYLVYLTYPLLLVLLLAGSKFFGKNKWNDEFLSLSQTKALQGFFAVCIIFHHLSQKTCAPWIKPSYIVHGLDLFLYIGYLFVAVFFFCSGYGLVKSFKSKENYLNGFLGKHIMPLVIALGFSAFIFITARSWMRTGFPSFFSIGEPQQFNPNAWFPVTLIIFYIGFYFSFKYSKSTLKAILFTCGVVVLYSLYCDFMLFGTWWYNSVSGFILGLFVAEYEKPLIEKVKKHYVLSLIASIVITVAFYILSVYDHNRIHRLVILFSQLISSASFVVTVMLIGMKVKIGNKVLKFLGGFTLELYLVHNLFIEMFGYCFLREGIDPFYYISNPFLNALAVIACAVPSGWLLHFLNNVIRKFFRKYPKVITTMKRDLKRIVIGLAVFLVIFTIIRSFISHSNTKELAPKVAQYAEQNIEYATVNGKKMAAYIRGSGKHTIVITSNLAPSMLLNPIVDLLSDDFRVIALDNFGTGFSDITDTPRTAENIAYEMHEAIHQFGVDEPFIFIPHSYASTYTLAYAQKYPQDIEAIISFDDYVPEIFEDTLRVNNMNEAEYKRASKRMANIQYYLNKLYVKSGIVEMGWAAYSSLFTECRKASDLEIIGELYKTSFYTENTRDEAINEYDNYYSVMRKRYPDNIPTYYIIGFDTWKNHRYYGDWYYYHQDMLTPHKYSRILVATGSTEFVYWNQRFLRQQIINYIKLLDSDN